MTRWYEEDPVVQGVMHCLEGYEPHERAIVCDWFLQGLKDSITPQVPLKQLGDSKLKSYWKGSRKQRWYDTDPVVHRAVQALFLMEPPQRRYTAQQFSFLLQGFQAYLAACSSKDISPSGSAGSAFIQKAFNTSVVSR